MFRTYRFGSPWPELNSFIKSTGQSTTLAATRLVGVFATKGWTSSSFDGFSVEDEGDESSRVDDGLTTLIRELSNLVVVVVVVVVRIPTHPTDGRSGCWCCVVCTLIY